MKLFSFDDKHLELQLLRRKPILIPFFFHSYSLWKSRDESTQLLTSASYIFGRNLALGKQDFHHSFHAQLFTPNTTYTIIILQNR
jgi:hypothetical protein